MNAYNAWYFCVFARRELASTGKLAVICATTFEIRQRLAMNANSTFVAKITEFHVPSIFF